MPFASLLALLATSAAHQGSFEAGATFRLYEVGQGMTELPLLIDGQTPNVDRLVPKLDFGKDGFFGFKDHFYVEVTAQLNVPATGDVAFRLSSDDGSVLLIDGK